MKFDSTTVDIIILLWRNQIIQLIRLLSLCVVGGHSLRTLSSTNNSISPSKQRLLFRSWSDRRHPRVPCRHQRWCFFIGSWCRDNLPSPSGRPANRNREIHQQYGGIWVQLRFALASQCKYCRKQWRCNRCLWGVCFLLLICYCLLYMSNMNLARF